MNFGNINLKNQSTAQAQVTFNCTKDVIFYIKPNGGMNGNGANNFFYMKNSSNSDLLAYSLSGYRSDLGTVSIQPNTVFFNNQFPGNGPVSFDLIGNIDANQQVSAGNYLDTVILNISF
jgi:spore coat protein U-like protein